jgi:hypothetical protein
MPVLGTLPDEKRKLLGAYAAENSRYQTNLGRLSLYKTRVQNPNEPKEVRDEAIIEYNKLKKVIDASRKKLETIQDKVDSLEGGKALTKIQEEYKDLLEQKSLLIDPNDPLASEIDAKIEKLVKPFQNAYSKVVGTRVSETVARINLLGKKVPRFGEPEKGQTAAQESAATPVATGADKVKPSVSTPPVAGTPEKIVSGDKGDLQIKGKIPLDTQTFESTFTTGGVPAGYVPSEELGAKRVTTAVDIAEKYGLSEALYKNIPSLQVIFNEFTNPKDPNKKMTEDELIRRIRNDVWYKKNSAGIKQRFVQYYNYRDLQESGQADGTTQYEQDIEGIVRSLEKRATEIGSGAAADPTALRNAAENIYLTNKEKDTTFIDDFLASSIRSVAGTIGGKTTEGYSGAALQNYNALVTAARSNGFQVSDIIPGGSNVDQVLQGIASGKIDVNRVVADARKLAAQGQPQYVRDLLAQGYNLDQVFKPYRTAMANVLEIGDPDQIDLNDPLLRSAITDKGDMNLYDFKKALRQDNRWQYTEQAKKDVSTAAFNVLRDFGFQG